MLIYTSIWLPQRLIRNRYWIDPSVVLAGIGYKDFTTIDSLRNRDNNCSTAIPEYEMSVSGAADKFLSFINT